MTKNKKFIAIAVSLSLAASMLFVGCSEADKANYNISKQADYFESERKLTVYNARTDTIILEQKVICLYPIMIMESWYVP